MRGNHTVAEDALRSVVQRAPEMASAWFQLALALRCQQKGAEALVAVERALQADRALTDAKLLHVELLATVAPERARPVIKEEDQ
ncbi:MAG: hypothetical protein FJ265_13560 [Planctomycetes bacterium]|nr:hypothetical protein [Planctomycetota bacterium]